MDPIAKDMPSTRELMNARALDRLRYPIHPRDCAVRAIAVVTLKPYEEVRQALFYHSTAHNRSPHHPRARMPQILSTIKHFGCKVEDVSYPQVKTIKAAGTWLGPSGVFLLAVSGHVAGMRDGVVYDWASGRLHRIRGIYRISQGF